MSNYARHFSARQTPQTQPAPGKQQVQNSAGGYVFQISDWDRLDRFLILGCESPTYYATARNLTVENAQCVLRCLQEDPARTVARIVEINTTNRAPKPDPAIFALALATAHEKGKLAIGDAVNKVCRIPTHLFLFVESALAQRGWGRLLKTLVANWYAAKDNRQLAYQCSKYQSRNGWAHRDLLRLTHTKSTDPTRQDIYHWCVKGWPDVGDLPHPNTDLLPIWAMEKAKRATSASEVVKLIDEFDLVRECIPTQFLTDPLVWEALLSHMPLTAMIRNLATMTRIGLLTPLSNATRIVREELGNEERLRKARVHPIALLSALKTYAQGHGERSGNTWVPVPSVVDALDAAFYLAFKTVEPTNKRWLLALDVSSSMSSGMIAGVPGLTPRQASVAMALVTANTESNHEIVKFNRSLSRAGISPRQRLDDALAASGGWNGGGTDCAQPMIWALTNQVPVDIFVTYTDSETWAGGIHPFQALREYREKTGINARMAVVGMTSTGFSIADPEDPYSLNVVGFDTAVPDLLRDLVLR